MMPAEDESFMQHIGEALRDIEFSPNPPLQAPTGTRYIDVGPGALRNGGKIWQLHNNGVHIHIDDDFSIAHVSEAHERDDDDCIILDGNSPVAKAVRELAYAVRSAIGDDHGISVIICHYQRSITRRGG